MEFSILPYVLLLYIQFSNYRQNKLENIFYEGYLIGIRNSRRKQKEKMWEIINVRQKRGFFLFLKRTFHSLLNMKRGFQILWFFFPLDGVMEQKIKFSLCVLIQYHIIKGFYSVKFLFKRALERWFQGDSFPF